MVNLSTIRTANSNLVNSQPLVAVFVGGNSGIGEYTLRALVDHHSAKGKGLCIYIVGRNAKSANKIIEDCMAKCPDGKYHFINAKDLSSLRNVDDAAAQIIQHQQENHADGESSRVDMLFMTQGGIYFPPRKGRISFPFYIADHTYQPISDTPEGLDLGMSMHYYSRARMSYQLLPLLRSSTLPTGSHIISVYAAGGETVLHPTDLSLRQPPNFKFDTVRSHCSFMTTSFFERVAAENEGRVSCVYVFPGLVITPGFYHPEYPAWFKVAWWLLGPFVTWWAAIKPEEAGQRMLFLAGERFPASEGKRGEGSAKGTNGEVASGAYAVNNDGEATDEGKRKKAYQGVDRQELNQAVWAHTMKAFDVIKEGKVFEK